jgi:hypothetical protein
MAPLSRIPAPLHSQPDLAEAARLDLSRLREGAGLAMQALHLVTFLRQRNTVTDAELRNIALDALRAAAALGVITDRDERLARIAIRLALAYVDASVAFGRCAGCMAACPAYVSHQASCTCSSCC